MGDSPLHTDIEPKEFWSATMAERFVDGVDVYPGYWRRLVADCPFRGHDFGNNKFKNTDKGHASRLMFLGIIKLYPIKHLNGQDDNKPPVRFPSLLTVKGIHYTLVSPSALLVESSPVVRKFTDPRQAARFLADLNMEQTRLNELSTTMGIATTKPESGKQIRKAEVELKGIQKPPAITPQITAMAQALMDKQFFLLEQQPERKPPRKGPEDLSVEEYTPKPYTLGPHEEPGYVPPENPHSGLHNQEDLTPNHKTSAESFKTTRQMDMDDLSEADEIVEQALRAQDWDEYKVEEILTSGDQFILKEMDKGDKLYGFVTGGRDISTLDNKAYWLDKKGFADVETEFFRQGHWDREGVKGYLALPCFNRANDMITVELTESQTVIKSTIGKATELLRYDGTDGYTTDIIGKIMGGGGTQISPNARKLALISGK